MHGADRVRFEEEEHDLRWNHRQPHHSLGIPLDVALVGSGVPRQVALVGCGKRKAVTDSDLPAHELYIGNPFRMAFRHAVETADDVHILSALHGLVSPYQRLAPYDMVMTQMLMSEQREWGRNVVSALKSSYPMTPIRLIFYAGSHYVRPVLAALEPELGYCSYEDPLKGLDLFKRLAWFKAHQTG